ncbi:MAG: GFA family protein [Pseudomonadota bacterium]
MNYQGSCHCGQVSFEVEGNLDQVLECNCSHCSRKGFLLWFLPKTSFTLRGPEAGMTTYTFNKHIIQHKFCSKCGCAPFGFGKDKSGAPTAAINIRCLENVDLAAIKRVPFDGRSL